jgi:putative membrane protein
VMLLAMLLLYIAGAVKLRRTSAGRTTIRIWQLGAFVTGWAAVAIALLSRLDAWSEVFFSAHMAQHEILMLVSAPLMVLGRPFIATMWALPLRARELAGSMIHSRSIRSLWTMTTGPVTVLVLHGAVLWMWHIPVLFEAALRDETVHAVQHLGFFLTAALFWWALIHGRYGRAGYGAGVLYVFATAMHSQILGALLTFGTHVWYPTHAARTGAKALDDQQLAGILMWVPFGILFVVIALALFAAWLGEIERRTAFTTADRLTGDADA